MEKINYLKIDEKEYPIRFDWYVLKEVQEKYGTVNKFEKLLKGIKFNGEYDEDGNKIMTRTEPDIGVMIFAIPLVINEGIEIENMENHKNMAFPEEKEIIRSVLRDFYEVAADLIEEFDRCMMPKK